MIEFIQKYLIDNYVYIQLIPVFVGLFYWKRFSFEYKLFIVLLFYSAINELVKIFYLIYIDANQNRILTNIYNSIYFGFLFWLFFKKYNSTILRKTIIIICVFYVLSIYFEVFVQGMNYHNQTLVIPYLIGGVSVLVCVFYYFIDILKSDKVIAVHKDLLFWIAIAHFIYYLGFTPLKLAENDFVHIYGFEYYLRKIKVPVTFLKCIILSVGFICSRQKIQ